MRLLRLPNHTTPTNRPHPRPNSTASTSTTTHWTKWNTASTAPHSTGTWTPPTTDQSDLRKPALQNKNYTTIPTHHINHPEWATKVQRQYQEHPAQHTIHDSLQCNKPAKHIHPLQRLKTYKEAMWLASQQMQDEELQQPQQGPSNPNSDDTLLSHMLSTISHSTRHDTPQRPPRTYLVECHPMAKDWNQALNIPSPPTRLHALKDMALTHLQETTIREAQQLQQQASPPQPRPPPPQKPQPPHTEIPTAHSGQPSLTSLANTPLHMGKTTTKRLNWPGSVHRARQVTWEPWSMM